MAEGRWRRRSQLGDGGVYTSWFQFSKTRDSVLPTHFGERYGDDLKRIANLKLYLHANVTGLRLAADAREPGSPRCRDARRQDASP